MTLSSQKLQELDSNFKEFQHIERDISFRKFELTNPWKPNQERVGGRSNTITKPQEQLIITFEDDDRLNYLYNLKDACERAIMMMDNEQQQIYYYRYQSPNYYDWESIGEILHHSRTQMYRKRYKLLSLLARCKGMI